MNSPVTTLYSTLKGFGMTQTTHEDRDNQESYCNFCGMCTVYLAAVLYHDCDVEDFQRASNEKYGSHIESDNEVDYNIWGDKHSVLALLNPTPLEFRPSLIFFKV